MTNTVENEVSEKAVVAIALREGTPDVLENIKIQTTVDDFVTTPWRDFRWVLEQIPTDNPFDVQLFFSYVLKEDAEITLEDIFEAISAAPLTSTLEDHIRTVKGCSAARKLLELSSEMAIAATESRGRDNLLEDLHTKATLELNDALSMVGSTDYSVASDVAEFLLNDDEYDPGKAINTGIDSIDELLGGGLGLGTMTVLAARPGFGKSSLALDFVRNNIAAIENNEEVVGSLFISMEMGKEEVVARLLGGMSEVSHRAIRTKKLTDAEKEDVEPQIKRLNSAPVYIATMNDSSINQVFSTYARANADAQKRFGTRIKLVIWDYIQLISSADRAFNNRSDEIGFYSKSGKSFALREDVALVAISQLNRGNNKNSDVEYNPSVRDLRDSGSLEQDADLVMLLAKYADDDLPQLARGDMKLIVAKHRNGALGELPLTFIAPYPKFVSKELTDEDMLEDSVEVETW